MRDLCYRCLRPKGSCYCRYATPVQSGVKFVLLMHPKEAKRQRTGTGRLAHICLPGSEILVGVDFSQNERLNALLGDDAYFPVLLYPSQDAIAANSPDLAGRLGGRTLLAILIDSTWFCSKKMLRLSTNLAGLPRVSFGGAYKSIFTFKEEPYEHCVSTIESCYYLIKELEQGGVVPQDVDPEPLMTVFKRMIQFQLTKENERIALGLPGTHQKDWKYTRIKEVPQFGLAPATDG